MLNGGTTTPSRSQFGWATLSQFGLLEQTLSTIIYPPYTVNIVLLDNDLLSRARCLTYAGTCITILYAYRFVDTG